MSRRSRTALAALMMAITLGAGVAIGLVIGRQSQPASSSDRGDRAGPPLRFPGRMLERFKERLSLSADQAEKISAIIDSSREQAGEIHDKVRPELRAIRERSREQIRALLSPEQAAEYDKLTAEMEERRRRRGPRRPRRGGFGADWSKVDADKDGKVTKAECEASDHRLGRMCSRRFEALDGDDSGFLDEVERKTARERLRKHRDDRGGPPPPHAEPPPL